MQRRLGDTESTIRGTKQRIVLAHLVLAEGRPVPIDVLLEDLWDAAPPDAPHALQAHISRLRRATGLPIDFIDGAGYRLGTAHFESDTRLFARLCTRGRNKLNTGDDAGAIEEFNTALRLWRGAALGDLAEISGLRPFAVALNERWRNASDARIEAHLRTGQGEAIIGELRTSLHLDPLQEGGWRQLMLALHGAGRPTEAVATFHRARETFIAEMGTEPSDRLSKIHHEILRRDGTSAATPPSTPSEPITATTPPSPSSPITATTPPLTIAIDTAGTPTQPLSPSSAGTPVEADDDGGRDQLIGRGSELAVLQAAQRDSAAGLRVVTISGEPGAGKTRLATVFAEQVENAGGLVLTGRCRQAVAEPYHPFTEMLRTSLESKVEPPITDQLRRHGAGLIRLVPEFAELFPDQAMVTPDPDTGPEGYRAMEAVSAWLSALAAQHPLVLVVDDLQWADDQSGLLIQHVLRRPRHLPAQLLLTARDRELTSRHAMTAELLRQSNTTTHLALQRLTAAQTGELLHAEAACLGAVSQLPDWAESYVRRASGGNPLFVVELARHLLTSGTEAPTEAPGLPSGVRQVVQARVQVLPEPDRALLGQAALIGTPFDPRLLVDLSHGVADGVDAMLEAAEHAQLIEPVTGNSVHYRFTHEVVPAVLAESLAPLERAGLHTRIAAAMEHRYADVLGSYHHELARHHRNSDDPRGAVSAAQYLHLAGEDALAQGAPADAEALLAEALDLLGPAAEATRRIDLLIGLGLAQQRNTNPGYRETLLDASQRAGQVGDTARLTRAVVTNSTGWWSATAQIDHERIAGIENALAALHDEDLSARAQLLAAWALENVRDSSLRGQVLEASADALDLAERCGDDKALGTTVSYRFTVLYALLGDPSECLGLAHRLLEIAHRSGDRWMRLSASLCLTKASTTLGEFATADRHLNQALQLARAMNQPGQLWLAHSWQAMRAATRGRLEEAEHLITGAFELGQQTEQSDALSRFTGQMFTLRMMQGRLAEISVEIRGHAGVMTESIPAWRAALALTLARSEQAGEAEAILEEFAAGSFDQLPRDILWLPGMSYLAMTCAELTRADIAADLYRALVPYRGLVANNAALDAGPIDLHLGTLASLTGQDELAGSYLHAAAELCRRINAPFWLTQAQRHLAPDAASPTPAVVPSAPP